MAASRIPSDIQELSVAERILLVEDIWDSIATDPESVPVTSAQEKELDRRLTRYREEPEDNISWEQVKSNLRGSE